MRYEEPKMEIVAFETEDVIATSIVADSTDNWGKEDWDK